MVGRGLNGSALGWFAGASGTAANSNASGNVFDLREFDSATLFAYCGSPNAVFNVERSSTSNGVFGQFGASMVAGGSGITTRHFTTATSNVFHRVTFANNGGSVTFVAGFLAQGARVVPIAQQGNTTNYSDVSA